LLETAALHLPLIGDKSGGSFEEGREEGEVRRRDKEKR
jgi:hypothetical protein